MSGGGELRRRIGVAGAVTIGAGSMVGAGVYTAWSPAAQAAGTGLLIGLAVAGAVALCNATSSAQLAALHPESGGTYVYARHRLGPTWGHLAGWGFVVGKTASCAAMSLTAGAYLAPGRERPVAVAAVVVVTAVNLGGLSRTVAVTRLLLVVSVVALGAVVVAGWSAGEADLGAIAPVDAGLPDVLRSAGFLFFAFAGYARIATLGEEVRAPATTIPRAIPLALGGVLLVYAVVGVTLLATVDAAAVAATDAPLLLVVDRAGLDLDGALGVAAGIAAFGVLLNLVPGVSRTVLAMARRRELPVWFAHVDAGRHLPVRAELAVAAVVIALVVVVDLRDAIALSGVAVLTYYALTNLSALALGAGERRWPRPLAGAGLVGCVALALSLPFGVVLTGAVVLAIGVVVRTVTTAVASRPG